MRPINAIVKKVFDDNVYLNMRTNRIVTPTKLIKQTKKWIIDFKKEKYYGNRIKRTF